MLLRETTGHGGSIRVTTNNNLSTSKIKKPLKMQGSGRKNIGEEDLNDLICYECNNKVQQDTIFSHICFTDIENVYFSGRYIMKSTMLCDNNISQTAAESKNEHNNTSADEADKLPDDIDLSSKSVLWNSKAIKCLLSLYPKYKNLLDKRKIVSKKMMYACVYKEMCKYGYTFTSIQIENKMKAFEKTYKKNY
ncbi:PREDICTED: uncharacterized protein LOC108759542 isoform X1 [Trachymyrmex cornetzi]|uniref:uncharacterized protein LOC108759542 isoform X1 n=1 Tax=Trachymyrmex cornetzi TaxID=471704 RepID=UPI00084F81CE|nr:PREDICTED: uncharacterized protein LOC108759542 isoform X1 [Trachymyrmex cornetzi]XP_018360527.1 PREDICTED: uncharacterized protein LOC108759542 isoform X1 [Trachymyrmex cornetzi]XP_018360528.1 PREDICTED: uncharacterized protein LOC108759542 isoform X1 [Trachymyrmex cornetzi]